MPSAGIVWRRAAPTLRIRDPHKDEKMAAIHKALDECSAEHPVFYEDEVDIHLHPKIGADWQLRGQQKRVVTPGQNEKYYLAGALHSGTGKVSYVGGNSKSSALFISLLKRLKATYRRAKTITLIVDNYIIHKSRETQSWLKENPKFRVIYQPVYSPWVNHVERLWQALHDTITRNHQCRSMWQLLKKVRHFMETVSPFPEANMDWQKCSGIKRSYLGKISRRDAVAQAIEANHYIYKNYSPAALIEKLKGVDSFTMADWIERYKTILIRRKASRNTYKTRVNQLETIKEKLGGVLLTEITTRHIAEFLDLWIEGGKNTMAGSMRSVLSDMFREAIVEGRISQNPVTPTRAPKIVVTRERLKLKTYNCIREAADQLPAWFPLAMDLALVTGQRREDITNMRFSDIYDDRLHIRQIKTGMMIAIPLSLSLPVAGLRLGAVVKQCRMVSRGII